jgi:hypothetical protein|nr:MAG TPA: hypothetical protein [Bacteriophage sp.]
MLIYNGNKLKFTSYSKIENSNPEWIGQTVMDEFSKRDIKSWRTRS